MNFAALFLQHAKIQVAQNKPQRLKPGFIFGVCGSTEVEPFPKAFSILSFSCGLLSTRVACRAAEEPGFVSGFEGPASAGP
jgi:hypothetical protein